MGALREVIKEKTITLHPPPKKLYSAKASFLLPDVEVTSVLNEPARMASTGLFARRWTLLGCAGSQFASAMVDAWTEGVPKELQKQGLPTPGDFQVLRLSLVEGALLRWLRRPLLATMRASMPSERHKTFFCHFGDASEIRRRMNMSNRYLGLVCLVNGDGVVRWHAHGSEMPTDNAIAALATLIKHEIAPVAHM